MRHLREDGTEKDRRSLSEAADSVTNTSTASFNNSDVTPTLLEELTEYRPRLKSE